MQGYNIFITEPDMEQLSQIVDSVRKAAGKEREQLKILEGELDRAQIVSSFSVPADVVTMHSRVRVKDLNENQVFTYTLVFPRDADFTQGKISVLAPVGTAILGCRAGDVIEWKVPGGNRRLRIEEVLYQPERAGRAARRLKRRGRENMVVSDAGQMMNLPPSSGQCSRVL